MGLILLSPLMILVWIITLCTEGLPVLFRQKRLGKHEKPFKLLKFRSMKLNAPQIGAERIDEEKRAGMVTKWGSFMRKASLDELPQLFNILVGQMSFIGPRPGMPINIEPDLVKARRSYVPSAYTVKPGLSGCAQVYMHREPNVNEKAKWDSYYVQHVSLLLDAKLFFWTVLNLFGHEKGR